MFCIGSLLNFIGSFRFCYFYHSISTNYCESNSFYSFLLLKTIGKSDEKFVAIALKSDNYRYRFSWKVYQYYFRRLSTENLHCTAIPIFDLSTSRAKKLGIDLSFYWGLNKTNKGVISCQRERDCYSKNL